MSRRPDPTRRAVFAFVRKAFHPESTVRVNACDTTCSLEPDSIRCIDGQRRDARLRLSRLCDGLSRVHHC